jgi:hypothetical protein
MDRDGWEAPDAGSFSWFDSTGQYEHRHRLDFRKINPPGTKQECQVAGGPWRGGDLSRHDAERLVALVRNYDVSSAILWVGGWQGIATVETARGGRCGGGHMYYFANVRGVWVLKRVSPWIS